MRLASFDDNGIARPAAVVGDEIVDLGQVDSSLPHSVLGLLEVGESAAERVAEAAASGLGRRPLAEVRLLAPVRPSKFFAIGLNYADHVAEGGRELPEHMSVFVKAVSCVNDPYGAVERPNASNDLDYEGELGFVIGRRCRHVTAEEAPSVIAGYLIVNDFSVRDWQTRTPQWTLGKSFDTHGPIGPWIVTADELGDPHALDIVTRVNGEVRQSSNTRNLIWDCFAQVEILSTACTLEPGDIIATGTPAGVAALMDGKPWLVPGDVVRVEVEGIGAIENVIVQEHPDSSQALNARVALQQPA